MRTMAWLGLDGDIPIRHAPRTLTGSIELLLKSKWLWLVKNRAIVYQVDYSEHENDMKALLRAGGAASLNVYSVGSAIHFSSKYSSLSSSLVSVTEKGQACLVIQPFLGTTMTRRSSMVLSSSIQAFQEARWLHTTKVAPSHMKSVIG